MQKPEYSGESVCPFPFRLTSLHRQSNIQPYCPEPVEYPQAPVFCFLERMSKYAEQKIPMVAVAAALTHRLVGGAARSGMLEYRRFSPDPS